MTIDERCQILADQWGVKWYIAEMPDGSEITSAFLGDVSCYDTIRIITPRRSGKLGHDIKA